MPFINQAVLDNNNNDHFNTTDAETTASRPRVDIATAAVAATTNIASAVPLLQLLRHLQPQLLLSLKGSCVRYVFSSVSACWG